MDEIINRLLIGAGTHWEIVVSDAAVTAGFLWRCPCGITNGRDDDACDVCGAARLWSTDDIPPRYAYGHLLTNLHGALREWFGDRLSDGYPAAVSFRLTEYSDGPAWATDGATLHFTDKEEGSTYSGDFAHSAVADALAEISAFDPPQLGDRLRVVVPAV